MSVAAYFRFPHLHADLVTFVAEDDVWLAPLDGGRAWRVSADHDPVSEPRISPDGTLLAWTSTRDGEPEVHLADIDGGPSRRLTYWSDLKTAVRGWTETGDVLAISAVGTGSVRRTWAYAVPTDGGPASRLPYGPVGDLAAGPHGVVLASATMGREPAWWKRYRGGTAGKLWLDADGTGEFTRILPDLNGNLCSPMWVGDRIAFLSDHEGVAQVYSVPAKGGNGADVRRHTNHEFYARQATADGRRIVYVSAGDLWLLENLDAEPRRLDIRLGGPRTARQPHPIAAADYLGSVAPDHTGRASAIEVRGTVHWLTHREGPARVLAAEPGVRGRMPEPLGDTGRVVWITDAGGEDALEIAPSDGVPPGGGRTRLAEGKLGRVLEIAASPDGKHIAVATHDGKLLLVAASSGEIRQVASTEHGDMEDMAFSPDSGWLAWSSPGDLMQLRQIRMANVADLSTVDVTPLRFTDYHPVFTLDGKHLAFLSVRTFDPVYDAHVFELSFPIGCRPQLVPLAATTPSPFAPQREGRPASGAAGGQGPDEETDPPRTQVDLEGLAERVVPFPVAAARYSGLRAAKDGVLWLREPVAGALGESLAPNDSDGPKGVLERFDFPRCRTEVLVDEADWAGVSGDGNRVVVWNDDKLRAVPADRPAERSSADGSADDVDIDLTRVRVTVDPAAEWRQSYDEAGRLMRDHFWRADMGGVDWQAVLDRYRPLLDRIGAHSDLVDLLWEVQGELGTSHAYVTPPGEHVSAARRQGLLGADLERDAEGNWRITRVLPGDASDSRATSPLAAPGVAVRAGDALIAVNGRTVDPTVGPAPLLAGTANKPTELTVRPAAGGEPRRVVVVPIGDEERLRYQDWVAGRRAYVHERSGGRLGYLHVPDMQAPGWAQLHRDLRLETAREGLIVDVRENRGGHTSQLVVEKLARQVIGWDVARSRAPWRYPDDAPRGPVVAVANEFSGSDGDIVTAVIRQRGIGPVVGTRTWGGVIGIDQRYGLVDGTQVTQPRYATWFSGPGWGIENYGVDPDVEVVITPQDWAAGRDPQLDAAIRLATEALAVTPAAVPPDLPPLDS